MEQLTSSPPTLLVIDDIPDNLHLMYQLFKDDYKVKGANCGARGIDVAEISQPGLILLDVMMPDMDGFEVCRHLKSSPLTQHIPVIFVTAKTEKLDETLGLQLGAVDYITKPLNPDIIKSRVNTHIQLKIAQDLLKGENQALGKEVERRTREVLKQQEDVQAIQDIAFYAMVSLAETRDNETGNHICRTQNYIKRLAEQLSLHPQYAAQLDPVTIDLLYKSAPLHDIGKIGISDTILLKKGKLTEAEFEIMKTHTTIGHQAIQKAEVVTGRKMEFLKYAKEIAYYHHEHWDGNGYLTGLAGTAIPLSARLMAVRCVRRINQSPRIQTCIYPSGCSRVNFSG
ncbi:response regulator [Shewanella mangrovi]|uniref:response regulator n=1 Tax=Shewanella mangrovi TaxID=1515746 RepID=UPI000A682C41|nr:response regulator [Shewanella mangrovi]